MLGEVRMLYLLYLLTEQMFVFFPEETRVGIKIIKQWEHVHLHVHVLIIVNPIPTMIILPLTTPICWVLST